MRDLTEQRTFSREIEGTAFEITTGLMAQNAAASCTIRYGDTMLLATVCDGDAREGIDFFPLTVDFEERMYAIGKIPGSFFRREGRPGEGATLAARMTDRPIRPLFPKGFRREVQVVLTLLSSDRETPADVFGTTGASIVLGMSHIPFVGPVSSVRVSRVDGELKAFPTYAEIEESDLDLIVAGTAESVVMIEAGANQLPEADVIAAIGYAQGIITQLNELQQEIVEALGVEKTPFELPQSNDALIARVRGALEGHEERMLTAVSEEGFRGMDELAGFVAEQLDDDDVSKRDVRGVIEDVLKPFVRKRVMEEGLRVDGRPDDEVRELEVYVGLLPRAHGSGLFRRGQTQVLSVATLGPIGDRQRLDNISPGQYKRFMHHYNFPPFSVGEARFLRGPGRREIGHGLLAERALAPLVPSFDDFPYTIRIVSDTLMSNGSSSMASVCGSTLALMDAGVPLIAPVAGIAMGLVTDEDSGEYRVLTDIAGIEDAFGDMDFKVAGTAKGVTAVQLDTKLKSLPSDLLDTVFDRARKARLHILTKMSEVIETPREELSEFAPMITTIKIDPEKIGTVIGPGGRVIKRMVEETGAQIDVEDDGSIFVSGADAEGVRKAIEMINGLTKEIEVGEVYEGPVTRIMTFGAFVEILPGKDGLVHISDLANERVDRVEDVVNVGDTVKVRVVEIDNLGRVNLSRKALLDGGDGGEDGGQVGFADEGYNEEEIPSRSDYNPASERREGATAGARSGGGGRRGGSGGGNNRGGGGGNNRGGRGGRGGGGGRGGNAGGRGGSGGGGRSRSGGGGRGGSRDSGGQGGFGGGGGYGASGGSGGGSGRSSSTSGDGGGGDAGGGSGRSSTSGDGGGGGGGGGSERPPASSGGGGGRRW